MQRTIKFKLQENSILKDTILTYSQIYKYIISIGLKNKTCNKIKLHKLTYMSIRKRYPCFPSALVQTVRDVAAETLKRTKLRKSIKTKKYSSIRLDKRCLRIDKKNNLISMSSIKGRIKFNYVDTKHSKRYIDWKPIAGTLSYKHKNLFLNLMVEKEKPILKQFKDIDVLGIDRGINNILVTSDNKFYNSKKLRLVKGRYQYNKKVLQSKGTKSAIRKLKKISGKERRFVSDMNHCLSKDIAESDFKVFAIEKLTRMTNKKLGKRFNRKLGNWSFKQFENYLEYKAEALGKQVVRVNPRYTSQKCSNCNKVKKTNRNGNLYSCDCGFQLHADLNASRNIAERGISMLSRLSVNQPTATSRTKEPDSCKPINSFMGN